MKRRIAVGLILVLVLKGSVSLAQQLDTTSRGPASTRDAGALALVQQTVQRLQLSASLTIHSAVVHATTDDGTPLTWIRIGNKTRLDWTGSVTQSTQTDVRPNGPRLQSRGLGSQETPSLRFIPALSFNSLAEILADPRVSVVSLPDSLQRGHVQKVVLACRGSDLNSSNSTCQKWYIDQETSLPVRVAYRQPDNKSTFQSADADATFSDIKIQNGLSFPGTITTRIFGSVVQIVHVSSIEINPTLPESQYFVGEASHE